MHTALTMKRASPVFTGIAFLLVGILVIIVNSLIFKNSPFNIVGIVGIVYIFVGVVIVIVNFLRKED